MVFDRLDDPRAIPQRAWRFAQAVPEECRHGAKHHAVEERQATKYNEF
jgi:hypothetical protein